MQVDIREFEENDVPYKVKWINDDKNNKFLHYDLPLREDKTLEWYKTLTHKKNRADYTVVCDGEPVGIIGLLDIDQKNKKAEYYICIGEQKVKGLGVAQKATDILIRISEQEFSLNKIYLFTEIENIPAQKLFEKMGFQKEGLLKEDIVHNNKYIDRYVYGLNIASYLENVRWKNEQY